MSKRHPLRVYFSKRPFGQFVLLSLLLSVFTWRILAVGIPLGSYNDDAHYFLSALALAKYGRVLNLCLPGHPPQTAYSVGYPLLLAPFADLSSSMPWALSLFQFVMYAAANLLFARLAWRRLSRANAAWATLWWHCGLIPASLAGTCMPDVSYLAASLLPFVVLDSFESGTGTTAAVVASCALAALIRPVGLFLLPALAWQSTRTLIPVNRRRFFGWSAALLAITAIVALIGGGARGLSPTLIPRPLVKGLLSIGDFSDLSTPEYIWIVLRSNAVYYGDIVLNVLALPQRPAQGAPVLLPLLWALRLAWAGVFIVGLRVLLRRRDALTLYSFFYAGFLLIWFLVDLRYVLPLRPLLILATFVGFEKLEKIPRLRALAPLKYVIIAAALYLGAGDAWLQHEFPRALNGAEHAWIRAHTEPDARIADEIDGALHLYTGRYAYPYPWDAQLSPTQILDQLGASGVEYYAVYPHLLAVSPSDLQVNDAWHQRQRAAVYALIAASADFHLEFDGGASLIYRRLGAAQTR